MLWPSGLMPCHGTSLPERHTRRQRQSNEQLLGNWGLGAHCTVWRAWEFSASWTLAAS